MRRGQTEVCACARAGGVVAAGHFGVPWLWGVSVFMALPLSVVPTLLLPPPRSFFPLCLPASPKFTKIPTDQIGVSGGVASFVCQATGNPKPGVYWNKKGKKVNSQRIEVVVTVHNGSLLLYTAHTVDMKAQCKRSMYCEKYNRHNCVFSQLQSPFISLLRPRKVYQMYPIILLITVYETMIKKKNFFQFSFPKVVIPVYLFHT